MNVNIPWDIRHYNSLDRNISIGDKVAFVYTNYKDNFKAICEGIILEFTKCFVKIKPINTKRILLSIYRI